MKSSSSSAHESELIGDPRFPLGQMQDSPEGLIRAVYEELRAMARERLEAHPGVHSLQATELVEETFVRLAGSSTNIEHRGEFFAAAAEVMRHILVERSRRYRGGPPTETDPFETLEIPAVNRPSDLPALSDALDDLQKLDSQASQVVHLRYFLGLTVSETAEILSISELTVERDWRFARRWLQRRVQH